MKPPNVIRVLLVDDERLARVGMRRLLDGYPDLEVVGECGDGAAAVSAIRALRPALVLLDVQMPAGDAFDVIAQVGPARMPAVIFVTAYDEHAIKAFEADAVDYLLKPVVPERLEVAVGRALRRLQVESDDDGAVKLETLLRRLRPASASAPVPGAEGRRIPVEEDGRYHFVAPEDVTWVEAAGNYVRLHTPGRSHRVRGTLEAMQRKLGDAFLRVNRSTLVNRDAVDSVEHFVKGSYVLSLRSGVKVRSSRHYRSELARLLGS